MPTSWGDKLVQVVGPVCTDDPFECGDPTAVWWLINVVTPLFSACCSLVVIIDVVSELLRKHARVKMGAEKLMAQLVSGMVA